MSLDYDADDGRDMDMSSIYSKSSGTSIASSMQLTNGKQEFGSYMSDGNVDGIEEISDYDDEHESVYAHGISTGINNIGNGNAVTLHASPAGSFLPVRKPRAFSISSTGSW